jgi:Holliday junction resolvase RusA-like endonuclease
VVTDNPNNPKWYAIEGINPEPWEASQAAIARNNGKPFIQFYKPKQLVAYQEAIKEGFPSQNPDAVMYPPDAELDVRFYFWRELAPIEVLVGKKRRTNVADGTNLQKALEDALQGLLFKNDRHNKRVWSEVVQQGQEITPFILIRIDWYVPHILPIIMRGQLEVGSEYLGALPLQPHNRDEEGIHQSIDNIF